ncbi:MAG: purine-nucleoside phosphorylase [Desulfonatronovibrio sp.]|nr:purine-nucleoside phosphorylase [Desulfovibrionales bacterium]
MLEKTKVLETENFFKKNHPDFQPDMVIVTGSGLSALADSMKQVMKISYSRIPNFPISTIAGHEGSLIHCRVNGFNLAILAGRAHLYEGYSSSDIVRPLRVLKLLGARAVILTNAAGALNPLFNTGNIMLISDHINLTGENPLVGDNIEELGPRFPDMSSVYSKNLINIAENSALELKIPLKKGVYVSIKGPSLETPAETRSFRILGADAIGMSTVLEAVAAKHMGMEILGLSCLTNKNLPDCMAETSHEEILRVAAKANGLLKSLILKILNDNVINKLQTT